MQGDGSHQSEMNKYDNISNTDLGRLIDEWVKSQRDRAILKRRLLDGICFEPLSEEFGLSVRQIKSIVYKSEKKLYTHLPS